VTKCPSDPFLAQQQNFSPIRLGSLLLILFMRLLFLIYLSVVSLLLSTSPLSDRTTPDIFYYHYTIFFDQPSAIDFDIAAKAAGRCSPQPLLRPPPNTLINCSPSAEGEILQSSCSPMLSSLHLLALYI